MLCEQRWPAIASSEALRKAVMIAIHGITLCTRTSSTTCRGRCWTSTNTSCISRSVRRADPSIRWRARRGDVFRMQVAAYREWSFRAGEYHNPAGILFDDISARVDCSDDDTFPPEAAPVTVTYYVIRKSDGHMAILVDDDSFGQGGRRRLAGRGPSTPFPSTRR